MTARVSLMRLLATLLILVGVALVQGASELSWFGIRPNISFAVLVALAFVLSDFFIYAALVLVVAALVGPAPGFSFEELAVVLILFAVFFMREKISVYPLFGAALLSALGTLVFYLVVDPGFIVLDVIAVLSEMLYNCLIAVLFSVIFQRIFSYGKTSLASF